MEVVYIEMLEKYTNMLKPAKKQPKVTRHERKTGYASRTIKSRYKPGTV